MNDFSDSISPSVSGLRTAVFWNVDDFPFPTDFTPDMIYNKFDDSLSKIGYGGGHISIFAYAVKTAISDDMVAKCREKRIYFLPAVPEDKYESIQRMIHDIYFWALDAEVDHFCTERVNLVVISNDIQGKINLDYCIGWMTMRGCHTFLLQPAVHIQSEKPQSSVWQGCLLNGGVSSQPSTYPRGDTSLLKRKSSVDTDSQD